MGAGYKAVLKAVLKAQMRMLVGCPGEWGWGGRIQGYTEGCSQGSDADVGRSSWRVGSGAGYKAILKAVLKAQMQMLVGWLVVLRLNVPVNNFSVMSGRSHRFLGN